MRVIDRRPLDEVIRLTRKYAETGDADLLGAKNDAAEQASISAFSTAYRWLAIADMVSAILGPNGLNPSAPSSVIYRAFEAAGIAIEGEYEPQEVPHEDD